MASEKTFFYQIKLIAPTRLSVVRRPARPSLSDAEAMWPILARGELSVGLGLDGRGDLNRVPPSFSAP